MNTHQAARDWEIEVFFDGDCPICRREISLLRWLDRRERISFVNIADASFRATDYGRTQDELMDQIYARLPDGDWIKGVEVFRRLYGAVGLGLFVPLTRLPVVSHMLDWGYDQFAAHRLRWTGRCRDDHCQRSAKGA